MSNEELRTKVVKWAKKVGERRAQSLLIGEGASPNTAQKLTRGNYPHQPGPLLAGAILRALDTNVRKENQMTHQERMALAWCQYNGQKGTAKQIASVLKGGGALHLDRMLAERGIVVQP